MTVTSVSGETMMILFRRILTQRNLMYANIFVSVSSWWQENKFFHYFGLLRDLLHRQDLTNKSFESRLKFMAMFLSSFWKKYFTMISPGWVYCLNSRGSFETTVDVSVINHFNCLNMSWVFCTAISFSSFYWKFKITLVSN